MDFNMTQLVAQFLPPGVQAWFFAFAAVVYVAGNALLPFLSKYQFNGWEHMLYMAFKDLRVDKTTQQVEFKIPDDQMQKIKSHLTDCVLDLYAPMTPSASAKSVDIKQPVPAPAPAAGVAAIVTNNTGGTTMKMLVSLLVAMALAASVALADTTPPASTAVTTVAAPGWGPSVVGSVGAFYFNGNYSLLNGGAFVGAAYGFTDKAQNVNSVGFYAGPSSQLINGVTTTTINAMVYLNLYQTASMGGFGVGLGTRLWQSGLNMGNAIGASTTYLALGYKF